MYLLTFRGVGEGLDRGHQSGVGSARASRQQHLHGGQGVEVVYHEDKVLAGLGGHGIELTGVHSLPYPHGEKRDTLAASCTCYRQGGVGVLRLAVCDENDDLVDVSAACNKKKRG